MENGDLNDAVTHLKLALDLADRVDNTYFHDIALNNLGCAYLMLHQYDDAIGLMEQVLDHRRALNDPHGVAALLHNLGETYVSAGRFATAVAYLEEANEINHATRTPWFQAKTLEMLGVALLGTNQPERARECWTRALTIMDRLGHPLAARVRDRLDELDRPASVAGSG
jgi:tetratricopeptide (TPR) repeat protein